MEPSKYSIDKIVPFKDKMPRRYFYTVLLLWADGKNYQTIATELNKPVGTIKSRVHRAKKHLDRLIEENGIQHPKPT